MINLTVPIHEILFEPEQPTQELIDSIRIRGIAIPVQVNREQDHYRCLDGRKRLSACQILAGEDPRYARIPIVILNDFSKSGSGFWGNTQNLH